MTELLTSAQMRATERAAIESGAVTGLELMERAGQGVVAAILAEWPGFCATPGRAVVLCGPGNNGGDGFVVARLLKGQGWEVAVFLYGDASRLPPDARVNHQRWGAAVSPLAASSWDDPDFLQGCDLLVDALFGIGLTRAVDLPLPGLSRDEAAGRRHRVVAIDVPSGLCADSGREIGPDCVVADLTVTFHRMKPGHLLAEGPAVCGRTVVADIGLPPASPRSAGPISGEEPAIRAPEVVQLPRPDEGLLRKRGGHKFSHGHALLLSGPAGHGGAARLSARGALRIGAGLVTLGCPPEAMPENAARLDAVMLRAVADGVALTEVLQDRRITALCLGPGMGTGARAAGLVAAALRDRGPAVVLDADALTVLSQDPDLFGRLHDACVLTPHGGEFARLFPDLAAKLAGPVSSGPAFSKIEATREAARRAGCVVLFKGADTVIAAPDGRSALNAAAYDRAAPWLATAGSGDVLAGFITGLLARGAGPFAAACTGAWLHVECARSFGPGLIAEDLPEELPVVFRTLEL